MSTQGTGIGLSDLARLLEPLRPIDCDGWFAVAIARLARGDLEGGLRTAERAFNDMVDRYNDLADRYNDLADRYDDMADDYEEGDR